MFFIVPPLAALTGIVIGAASAGTDSPALAVTAASEDVHSARFERCTGSIRVTCVVDGDTIWLDGTKIRLADINTPEISQPACPFEAELGERASARLQALLNAGPFSLARQERDEDRYGRKLRVVTRGGASLGDILVAEGLAEPWQGRRGSWC